MVASELYVKQTDTLAVTLPCTTRDRGWSNHVKLAGKDLKLPSDMYAMTEQPRTIARERLTGVAVMIDVAVMREVDMWLRDFTALPQFSR